MPSTASTGQQTLAPSRQHIATEDDPNAMHIDISLEEEESSADKLQPTPKQNNKKRTLEQRSPQKQPRTRLAEDVAVSPQKSRWEYLIT